MRFALGSTESVVVLRVYYDPKMGRGYLLCHSAKHSLGQEGESWENGGRGVRLAGAVEDGDELDPEA